MVTKLGGSVRRGGRPGVGISVARTGFARSPSDAGRGGWTIRCRSPDTNNSVWSPTGGTAVNVTLMAGLFPRTTRNPRVSTHDNITVTHGTLAVTVGSGTGAVVLPGGRPAAFEFLRFPVRVSHCRGRDQGVLRFQLPPIEPCMQFSRTRLTDVVHRVALPEGRQTAGGTPGLASTVGREHGARSPTCQAIRATVTVSYYLAVTAGIAGRSS
jgi:hypothetical protein